MNEKSGNLMFIDKINISSESGSIEDRLNRYEILKVEANTVRDNDKVLIRNLFRNFYNRQLRVGIGFQRAYGSILSGDYFDLIKLPDNNYLFVFADISGHGLPAYATLIRLRSAVTIAIKRSRRIFEKTGSMNQKFLIQDICTKFTDIMDEANTDDFACVNFTFITNDDNSYRMRFFNRSMLFPMIIRRGGESGSEVINLNNKYGEWKPRVGSILGSDLRKLLADDYLETPICEFTIGESDSVFFFSDGITEACNPSGGSYNGVSVGEEEFGEKRVEDILMSSCRNHPQEIINGLFQNVYQFIGNPEMQEDDMTAVLIDFPPASDHI
jgi:hypothetical protein